MTQPYPAAGPQYPQQPPAPQGYPQPPAAPQYPAQPQYAPPAPQGYPPAPANPYGHPQTVQNYPGPSAYPYGAPQQPPAPQAPAGPPPSLGDFYSQPMMGWGPSVTPVNATPVGTQILMVVAQHVTEAHIEHAEEYQKPGVMAYYRNGKPKLTMKIPVYVAPGTQYWTGQGGVQQVLDGRAQYYCQGGDKDLLAAAIAAAGGNAAEPPELGAVILVTKTGSRPNRSGNQSAVKTWQYWRPGPEAAGMAAQFGVQYPDLSTPKPAPAVAEAAPATAPQAPATAPQAPATAPQAPATPPAPPQQFQPQAPRQFAPPAAPPAVNVEGLDAERQALLAQLTGQQAAPVG